MTHTSKFDQHTTPPTHQDFHWINGPGQKERFADFLEFVRAVTSGVRSGMQIIYSSNLIREMNQDADPEQISAPAISKTDADNLYRLSLAAITALNQIAQNKIDLLNQQ